MTLVQAFILGLVQGLTEFLPISSSGHLVLVPWALGWRLDPEITFAFNVLVQVGTILAVMLYFRHDLWAIGRDMLAAIAQRQLPGSHNARLGWLIVLATVPGAVFGAAFKDFFESLFENPRGVSGLLLGTALLLTVAERLGQRARDIQSLGWMDGLVMGLFQALAIFPGISRSGSTIAAGMLRGLNRAAAARFSFLLAVPIMLGAGAVAALDLAQAGNLGRYLDVLLAGFVMAGVVGYLSIHWLLGFVARNSLYGFAGYCTLAGIAGLILSFVRG